MVVNKTIKYAIIDGVARGILLMLPGEMLVLFHCDSAYIISMVVAIAGALISAAIFRHSLRFAERLVRFYFLDILIFVITNLILLLNYTELHIFLIPRRELGNADGIIMIMAEAIFMVTSVLFRVVLLIAESALRKTNKK